MTKVFSALAAALLFAACSSPGAPQLVGDATAQQSTSAPEQSPPTTSGSTSTHSSASMSSAGSPAPTSSSSPNTMTNTSPLESSSSASSNSTATTSAGTGSATEHVSSEATSSEAPSATAGAPSDATSNDTSEGPLPVVPRKVYIAGDSTVATYKDTGSSTDQAGWGQMLHEYFSSLAQVDNRAVGGTTSRSFIDFGHLDKLAADISAGDALLVQFGTNDGNKTATYDLNGQTIPYYLEPSTDFKTYLSKYIDFAESREVDLVFVTPPPRNSAYCTGGNGTGGHAAAMRELGAERGIPVADLNTRSVAYLKAICPAPTPEDFFLLRGDGSVDGTHFQENGARILAGLVADELRASASPLRAYVEERP